VPQNAQAAATLASQAREKNLALGEYLRDELVSCLVLGELE